VPLSSAGDRQCSLVQIVTVDMLRASDPDPAEEVTARPGPNRLARGLSLIVGCYGRGLQLAGEAPEGGWRIEPIAPDARNVSHALWSARHRKLYAVREEDEGAIDVIAPDEGWQVLASISTEGSKPCHCALDASEGFLAVANYGSGDAVVFSLDPDGMPMPGPWKHEGSGHGVDPDRQDAPHAHWLGFSPDQGWLVQTDLGVDLVRAFRFSSARGMHGEVRPALRAPGGSGPRWMHFGLAGADAALVSELDSTLSLLSWTDGELYEWDRQSTRGTTGGSNLAGHLAVNGAGNRIYVTNRGDDTIALFSVRNGHLDLMSTVASGGKSPRYLCLIEEHEMLLVGHEDGGPVTLFDLSGAEPRRTGQIDIERVAWIGRRPR